MEPRAQNIHLFGELAILPLEPVQPFHYLGEIRRLCAGENGPRQNGEAAQITESSH
jgi:hypothetical protein